MSWDAQRYQQRHSYVYEYGQAVLDLLAPQAGERILDLGCGSGQLTAAIAATGALVIGTDSSPEMLAEARAHFPQLDFRQADAADFSLDTPVDAVFSNAVLHWVKDAAGVARSVRAALKPGGRFVVEFGGRGNVQSVLRAIRSVLGADKESESPWYFPSIGEYASLLEQHGFEPRRALLIDRPTRLEGEDGMEDWLAVFARGFVEHLDEVERKKVWREVAAHLRPANYNNGVWTVDYVRLRIVAVSPVR
jgi:trans-aconitate methyltransferase